MTEWRPVHGYERSYEVSRCGQIRGRPRWISRGKGMALFPGGLMTPSIDKGGYLRVSLAASGKKKQFGVHQLVCLAFVGPQPAGTQVAHLNGNPSDNTASNLDWRTPQQNTADKIAHGTHQAGEAHPRAKLTAEDVAKIRRRLGEGERVTSLASEYGVHQTTVSNIKSGKRWAEPMPARAEGIAQPEDRP